MSLPGNLPGFIAIHLAVCFGHKEIVTLLLDKETTLKQETVTYLLEMAQAMNRFDIIPILQDQQDKPLNGVKVFFSLYQMVRCLLRL
jgi:hypothetical protein